MQEKDHNYAKELLNYFDIEEKDFINFSDAQIKEISNKFSTAEVLDGQSGVLKSGDRKETPLKEGSINMCSSKMRPNPCKGSVGGCSKILHKCDYEESELYFYCPKVARSERGDSKHPTMKPQKLITQILSLFKTPNKQLLLDPFAGSGTTGIVAKNLGFDYILTEINPEYIEIINKRLQVEKVD